MKRGHIISLAVGIVLLAFGFWIASNTTWVDVKVPLPASGEALTNPFYAAQRFAEKLGARTSWDRLFTSPRPDTVIVLGAWHWDLSPERRDGIEHWVESGGRLVVNLPMLSGGSDDFLRWSGIFRVPETVNRPKSRKKPSEDDDDDTDNGEPCSSFQEVRDGTPGSGPDAMYRLCGLSDRTPLGTAKPLDWALRGESSDIQALRVRVGRGSVTVIRHVPFLYRRLFKGDHGALFVAATQLRRGDEIHFLSENEYPSMLALTWMYGAPVVMLSFGVIALALWRGGVRFGPLEAEPQIPRRSLAEQIRGTGQFALRHGGGIALHAACIRALDEAALRRVKAYPQLRTKDRATALAQLTGFNRASLASAIHDTQAHETPELRRIIALLETTRRQLLIEQKQRQTPRQRQNRASHGIR